MCFYKQIKSSPKIEKYITELSYDLRINTIKFFIRGHHLPITLDRWNSATDIDRNCKKCDQNELGDENHYIFSCDFFSAERRKYLPCFIQGCNDPLSAWQTVLSYDNIELANFAKFVSHISSCFEYDKNDEIDFENDFLKIKRAKVSRAGRIIKPNTRYLYKHYRK